MIQVRVISVAIRIVAIKL